MTNGTEENRSPEALSKHTKASAITLTTAASSIFSIPACGETPQRGGGAQSKRPGAENWKPEQTTQLTALLNNAAGIARNVEIT